MQEVYTLSPHPLPDGIPVAQNRFLGKLCCSDDALVHLCSQAEEWDLWVENDLIFVEYNDCSENCQEPFPGMFVESQGKLVGFYYDRHLFDFSQPDSHRYVTDQCSFYRNFMGTVTYTLRHRPRDRVLYDHTGCQLLSFPKGYQGEYRIPDHVSTIGKGAFSHCQLSGITIPPGITAIPIHAFQECQRLCRVTPSDDLEYVHHNAFSMLGAGTVTIPAKILSPYFANRRVIYFYVSPNHPKYTEIGGVLFDKTGTILICYPNFRQEIHYTIPEGVTQVAPNAFRNCEYLKAVTFPPTLVTYQEKDFRGLEIRRSGTKSLKVR